MAHLTVYFWRDLYPLLRAYARRCGVGVNRVVNLAVQSWLGGCDVEELRMWAEIGRLCREEQDLKRVSAVMLRSGSYLPQYADKLFREKYDKSESQFVRKGDVPLKALNVKEEAVMRRVLARREAIAQEIAGLLEQVLPKEKFRLGPKRSRSRGSRGHKSVNDVRKKWSDV